MLGISSKIITYGFAAGRVSVLETRMISTPRIKRLIEAESLEEVRRILTETDYGSDMRAAQTIAEVESALDNHLSMAYAMLRESGVPVDMERYFRSRYDFINLRVLLKSGFGQQIDVDLSPLGYLPVETAESLVQTHSFAGMPPHLEAAAGEAIAKYNADHQFEDIDIILDRHYFRHLLELAGRLRSKWITAYTKLLIDLANGRITVRAGREVRISDYLIEGGNIAPEFWIGLRTGGDIADRLESFPTGDVRDRLTALAGRGMPVGDYDLAADSIAVDFLLGARRFNVGAEPVFAYVAARRHEVKLLRLIVFGHLSGLAPARIQERVSRIYE